MYWIMLSRDIENGDTSLLENPDLSSVLEGKTLFWNAGQRFTVTLPEPLPFKQSIYGGNFIGDYFDPVIPVMRDSLLKTLNAAGVDNIQSWEATILTKDEKLLRGFRAINIIGLIKCADLTKSKHKVRNLDLPGGVRFRSLVIDESLTGGALLFRLYEAPHAVLVHDSVKTKIEHSGAAGVTFEKPEKWVG